MTDYFIGVDLGGTKILAAVATSKGNVIARSKRRTSSGKDADAGPDELIQRIAETARDAVRKADLRLQDVEAAGIGAPGPVNIRKGRVMNAVNLRGWQRSVDLGPALRKLLGVPVFVDNDVNVGLLGEAVYGAARGISDVVGLFVGTGLGGGLILDGKLRRGFRWGAGEVGHTYLHYPGQKPLDVEKVASRGAISRKLTEVVAAGQSPILAELLAKRKDGRITSGVIRRALAAGDSATQAAVAEAQEALGVLIASIANLLDPQAFVLGGGLVESLGEPFLAPIQKRARALFFVRQRVAEVQILPAALGDDSGALGAVALAKSMRQ